MIQSAAGQYILCDFDGTISDRDVTDTLLNDFGQDGWLELEDEWKAGKIGSRTCMQEQVALLDMSPAELDNCIDKINIDPGFKEFAANAKARGIPLHVVSDGLDYAIHRILERNGLSGMPVFANHLVYKGSRRWALEFPYAALNCEKESGHCKCDHVRKRCHASAQILYVGDSTSDFCVSGKVAHVLAKNKLISYCQENKISHTAIRNFADANALWPLICPAVFALGPELETVS